MPRSARKHSESGHYHVILRGVNRLEIFHDDEDRTRFLDTLLRFAREDGIGIVAYCLMDNHVHLLLNAGDNLSVFIKQIAASYVYYFNRKYDRVGHLFQERYRSEAVETDEYLLTAARYILQNPQKAGICSARDYPWSSWRDTASGTGPCITQTLCDVVGNRQALLEFLETPASKDGFEADNRPPVNDEDAHRLLCRISQTDHPTQIAEYPLKQRNDCIARAKAAGLSVRQIARLTGLDRNIVQRA